MVYNKAHQNLYFVIHNCINQLYQMQQEICLVSSDCEFMYHCQNAVCVHNDIFPLSNYSIVVYIFAGLASALCNIAGCSMGIFKILILIMLLRYELDEATGLAQAFVVGTALPNIMSIIMKQHPNKLTSLVNYKLLLVIIPCSLLGSTIGALGQTLIPKGAQLALLVLVFLFFSYSFFNKLRANCQQTAVELKSIQSEKSLLSQAQFEAPSVQKKRLLSYEKSLHLPEIIFTVAVFLVFQTLCLLVQGKLPILKVSKCSIQFCIGILVLFGMTLIYLGIIFGKMKKIFGKFRQFQIKQQIYLDKYRQFLFISAGAFAAGVIQGILGMGCGTCIMMVLLSYPIASVSASATSGYQILFTGCASLLQYYLNGQVRLFESFWMLGVCCSIGGVTTVLVYFIIQRLNQVYVNRLIYSTILLLCLMSIGLVVPTVLGIFREDGWQGFKSITFKC